METESLKIDLQRFAEGDPIPEPTPTPEPSPASTDWAKMLFDDKGKLNSDAYKVLQPYLDSEKHKHLDSWQKNNLSKYVEKDKFDQLQQEMTANLTKAEINTALIRELSGSKYPDLLMKEVNFANISKTENGLVGITEEIARIKTAYPDFWGTVTQPQNKGGGVTPPNVKNNGDEIFTTERLKTMSQAEIMANYDKIMKQGILK